MAMVAGGGFRGRSSGTNKSICGDCDQLRERLARCQQALQESRENERRQTALAEASEQAAMEAREKAQFHAARAEATQAWAVSRPQMCNAQSQTEAAPPLMNASSQTIPDEPKCVSEAGVQVEPPQCITIAAGTQTLEIPMADAAVQHEQDQRGVGVQASVDSQTNEAQTETFVAEEKEIAVQTEVKNFHTSQTQTDQIKLEAEPCKAPVMPPKVVVEVEVQTQPLEKPVKATTTKGVQAVPPSPPAPVHQALQTEPWEDEGVLEKLRSKIKSCENIVEAIGFENAELKASQKNLQTELRNMQQQVSTWMRAAQSKVFGHLNVLVVSPKAECTIRGENLDMTSWDIHRIQSLIEEEVIPRFTRVFAYEGEEQPPEVKSAIDGAMKEFASTFKRKLSEMLSNAGPKATRG